MNSQLRKGDSIRERQMREAVLNDTQLKRWYSRKAEIISLIKHNGVLYSDSNTGIKFVGISEDNHPTLNTLNKLIKSRTDQIIKSFES